MAYSLYKLCYCDMELLCQYLENFSNSLTLNETKDVQCRLQMYPVWLQKRIYFI